MSKPSKNVTDAIAECEAILNELDDPYVIFVFEKHGCSIADAFCCKRHMKENVIGLLNSIPAERSH